MLAGHRRQHHQSQRLSGEAWRGKFGKGDGWVSQTPRRRPADDTYMKRSLSLLNITRGTGNVGKAERPGIGIVGSRAGESVSVQGGSNRPERNILSGSLIRRFSRLRFASLPVQVGRCSQLRLQAVCTVRIVCYPLHFFQPHVGPVLDKQRVKPTLCRRKRRSIGRSPWPMRWFHSATAAFLQLKRANRPLVFHLGVFLVLVLAAAASHLARPAGLIIHRLHLRTEDRYRRRRSPAPQARLLRKKRVTIPGVPD